MDDMSLTQSPHKERIYELVKPLTEGEKPNPVIEATNKIANASLERKQFLAATLTIISILESLRITVKVTTPQHTLLYNNN